MNMNDLIERLRALARCEHSDVSVAEEAAPLVRAAALEEAAKVCEELDEEVCWEKGRLASGYECAAAIRAMKEQA